MSAPPDWYQDPQRPSGHLRWWDGRAWTEQRIAPPDAQVPAAWNPIRMARRHPLSVVLAAVFALVVVYGAADSVHEEPTLRDGPTSADDRGAPAEPEDEPAREVEARRSKGGDEPTKSAPRSRAPRSEGPRTYLVTRVVDGDTLELGNGETVRLVGIDAPEVGECGYELAAANLARLALRESVRLGRSDEHRDRYGRLLRYVDVGAQDAGLRLIKNGLAIARYDSRDGYGFHPRETLYVAEDKHVMQFGCAPKPQPFVQQPPSGGNCAPGYAPCVPPYPPDVDCADVNGPIHVSGSDPHGLDADGDGVACE